LQGERAYHEEMTESVRSNFIANVMNFVTIKSKIEKEVIINRRAMRHFFYHPTLIGKPLGVGE